MADALGATRLRAFAVVVASVVAIGLGLFFIGPWLSVNSFVGAPIVAIALIFAILLWRRSGVAGRWTMVALAVGVVAGSVAQLAASS